jgi:hypothetical protein
MCWDNAAMREDRKQAYLVSSLMTVSEASGHLTRQRLIALVAKDLPAMGNTAWHVDRMVSTMIRGRCLIRKNGLLSLNSSPDAQRNR